MLGTQRTHPVSSTGRRWSVSPRGTRGQNWGGGGGTSSRGRCLWPHPDFRNHISQAAPGGAGELPGLPTLDPTWEAARWWLCPGSSVCKPRTAAGGRRPGPRRSQAGRYLTSDFRLQNSRKQSNSLPVFKPPGLWCLVPQGGLRGVQAWEESWCRFNPLPAHGIGLGRRPWVRLSLGTGARSASCLCCVFVLLLFILFFVDAKGSQPSETWWPEPRSWSA